MNYLRSFAIALAFILLTVTTVPGVVAQTADGVSAEVTASVKKVTKKKVKKAVKKVKGKKVVKKKVKKVKKAKKVKKTPMPIPGSETPEMVAQHTVHIKDFSFQLPTLTIKKGETVEFIQDDEIGHTVSTDPHPEHTQLPGFVSDVLLKGQKFTYTFNDVGTWTYHCSPHPSMKGTIVVTE